MGDAQGAARTRPAAAGAGAHGHATPLWRQLALTAGVVAGVRDGRSQRALLEPIAPALRPGVQALSSAVLRHLGLATALARTLARREPPPQVDALLCTALALLSCKAESDYADFTLVNQAAEAAKRQKATVHHAAFLNACLRRMTREREALIEAAQHTPEGRWNHPAWWVERLRGDHPHAWEAILAAAQRPAPMVLRVNTSRTSVADFVARANQAGLQAESWGGAAVGLRRAVAVDRIPGFMAGEVSVQSASAQRAAPLLLAGLAVERPRVLDACAAPGGKTAHLLELNTCASVTALDVDPERCQRIDENLRRLGLRAKVHVGDATEPSTWWDGQLFDAILLDAPCSASGIGARHPDVRWLRRASDIAQLADRQERLLSSLWPLLAPGGRMLYATCSVFRQEGEERVEAFVARNTTAKRLASPGHLLPCAGASLPSLGDNGVRDDGFYYALLEKLAD